MIVIIPGETLFAQGLVIRIIRFRGSDLVHKRVWVVRKTDWGYEMLQVCTYFGESSG